MFKTLKAKIIFTSIIMLTLLLSVFIFFAIQSRMFTKQLMVQNYRFSIDALFVDDDRSALQDRMLMLLSGCMTQRFVDEYSVKNSSSYKITSCIKHTPPY